MTSTIVLQSHRSDRLDGWMAHCVASVRDWAYRHGFGYRWLDDALLDFVPDGLRSRYAAQPVVLSDLARLLWAQQVLHEGADQVIWCDADLLIFRDFAPRDHESFGRECWVQHSNGRLRNYRKIHNAWLQCRRDSVVLPFYIDRATALLARAEAPVVPQFIGPKLLTAWHNLVPFGVEERVGMLSPLVLAELLATPGPAVSALRAGHGDSLCALNLSASYENRSADGVCHGSAEFETVIQGLTEGDLAAHLQAGS